MTIQVVSSGIGFFSKSKITLFSDLQAHKLNSFLLQQDVSIARIERLIC